MCQNISVLYLNSYSMQNISFATILYCFLRKYVHQHDIINSIAILHDNIIIYREFKVKPVSFANESRAN